MGAKPKNVLVIPTMLHGSQKIIEKKQIAKDKRHGKRRTRRPRMSTKDRVREIADMTVKTIQKLKQRFGNREEWSQ